LDQRKKGRNVTLDDFNTLKVLGAGAFGTVMLIEEKKNRRMVCNESYQKRNNS